MIKTFKILLLFLLLSFVVPFNSKAQESVIKGIDYIFLDTLIQKAKVNYPRNKILKEKTDIAKNDIAKSNLSWLDVVTFTYLYRPNNNSTINLQDPNLLNGYQIGFNLNLGNVIAKPFTIKNSKATYKISKLEEEEYSLTLEREVKNRYYEYLKYINLLKISSKATLDAESLLKEMKYKYEKGEVSLEVYTNVLLNATNQNKSRIEAEAEVFNAKALLEELVGVKLEDIKINGRN